MTPLNTLLTRLRADFEMKPFVSSRFLSHPDLQTLSAHFWPGRFRSRDLTGDEERLFEVDPGSKILGRCRWHSNRNAHPTLVMWHGIEGSSSAGYMLSTAAKAFRAGFNVVRMNVRNCGGTDHLTPSLYHAGLTDDARKVIDELINKDQMARIIIAGFSLGGNQVLKLGGEYGDQAPAQLRGLIAISPSTDLHASSKRLTARRNWIYHQSFLSALKRRIKTKERLYPDLYQTKGPPGQNDSVVRRQIHCSRVRICRCGRLLHQGQFAPQAQTHSHSHTDHSRAGRPIHTIRAAARSCR